MQAFVLLSVLSFTLLHFSCGSTTANRHHRQALSGNQAGVCRYGRRLECCYGWKKNNRGQCEAHCEHECKNGECVGPNKCKCFPGYTGKTCNQDLNECGLKPRPCEHRCMNTYGSYKCYCLNGYTLMADGSCANSQTCSLANCQYGCEEVEGEIRCLCPSSGLQLGQDGKTCVDIDECKTGKNLCPLNRQCVNTFGSYYCKCQEGFDLKYLNGKYDCVDLDECETNTHKCSHHAICQNTLGSYKCRCKPGFRGNGFECSAKPFYQRSWDGDKGSADYSVNAIPDSQVRPVILGGELGQEDIKNAIPDPVGTPPPKIRQQPFDYDGEVYLSNPKGPKPEELPVDEEEEGEEEEGENNNQLNTRGDVFISEDFESVFGPSKGIKEIQIGQTQNEYFLDCNFDQGACEWVQDKTDDMDWAVAHHDIGSGYYMALTGLVGEEKDVARLKLLLSDRTRQSSFCLMFDYRIMGRNVGVLKVLLENNAYPVWEQSQSKDQSWQTESLSVAWTDEAPESIIFEAHRGKGIRGEIGLDNVMLTSGPCQEDTSPVY